jgi:hypothetical protein
MGCQYFCWRNPSCSESGVIYSTQSYSSCGYSVWLFNSIPFFFSFLPFLFFFLPGNKLTNKRYSSVWNGTTIINGGTVTTSNATTVVWGTATWIAPSATMTFGGSTTITGGTTGPPVTTTITPNPYPSTTGTTPDPGLNTASTSYSSGKPKSTCTSGCGIPCKFSAYQRLFFILRLLIYLWQVGFSVTRCVLYVPLALGALEVLEVLEILETQTVVAMKTTARQLPIAKAQPPRRAVSPLKPCRH